MFHVINQLVFYMIKTFILEIVVLIQQSDDLSLSL